MKSIVKLDAVKMMRDIRGELSRELQGLSYSEQKKCIDNILKTKGVKAAPSRRQHSAAVK